MSEKLIETCNEEFAMSKKDATPKLAAVDADKADAKAREAVTQAVFHAANEALDQLPSSVPEDLRNAVLEKLASELKVSNGLIPLPGWGLIGVIVGCVVYVLNFTFGMIEIIPDNLPIIGQMDEAGFTLVIFHAYRALNYKPTWLFRRDDNVLAGVQAWFGRLTARLTGGSKPDPRAVLADLSELADDTSDAETEAVPKASEPEAAGEAKVVEVANKPKPEGKSLALRFWEWLQE